MDIITAEEAARKWGITRRRVQILCVEGRILGAKKLGNQWVMPADTLKPTDARLKAVRDKKRIE